MSEQIITETATDSEEETTETVEESEETPEEPVVPNEWEDKYKGQLKVNRDLEKKLTESWKEREALKLQNAPAEEKAAAKARAEVEAEIGAKANARILKSEIRAAATGKLADPADAALYLDLSTFDVNDDGDVDSDALAEAIADLISRKPHLGVAKQNRFDGGADQGAKGRESGPPQWTEADLQKADREGRSDDIAKAKAAGNLNTILGIK